MRDRWPALLTKEETAEYLSVGIRTITRMMANGDLRPVLLGNVQTIRFKRDDLDAFIDKLPKDTTKAVAARQIDGARAE